MGTKRAVALHAALLVSALLAAGAPPVVGGAAGDAPCARRLRDGGSLPRLPTGAIGGEASSHDRMGGNDDGFSGKSEFASIDGGKYVLLDLKGPGCVASIGFTWLYYAPPHATALGNLQVFLDGESVPTIDVPVGELFAGGHPPFVSPLAEDVSGQTASVVSYVPIPFQDGIRIMLAGQGKAMFFYEVFYERYPVGEPVSSFSWSDSYPEVAARWSAPGVQPTDPTGQAERPGQAVVPPGGSVELVDVAGPGRVEALRLTVAPHETSTLEGLRLRTWWDAEAEPAVDAPLGLFFASSVGDAGTDPASVLTRSLVAGASTAGDYYSFWPMPFSSHARLEIANLGDVPVSLDWTVGYRAGEQGITGSLRAQHRRGVTEAGKDWVIADVSGARGRYVGTVLRIHRATSNATLEGDERVYVDGALSPAYYGTGTEDYFHSAWYFAHGPFSKAVYGAPVLRSARYAADKTNALLYRWHLSDSIPFERSLRFTIEHGHADDVEAEYESLALLYAVPRAGLALTDEVDVGDPGSEIAHGYVAEGPSVPHARTEHYEGERDGGFGGEMLGTGAGKWAQESYTSRFDPLGYTVVATTLTPLAHMPAPLSEEAVPDDGRLTAAPLSFRVAVDQANQGVRLRRRLDQGLAPQTADVYVDGSFAGVWHTFETNPFLRWRDEDLELPAPLTAGKSALEIRIVPRGLWTDYRYWVLSRATG